MVIHIMSTKERMGLHRGQDKNKRAWGFGGHVQVPDSCWHMGYRSEYRTVKKNRVIMITRQSTSSDGLVEEIVQPHPCITGWLRPWPCLWRVGWLVPRGQRGLVLHPTLLGGQVGQGLERAGGIRW